MPCILLELLAKIVAQSVDDNDTHQHHFEERAVFAGGGVRAVGTKELPGVLVVEKSEFGVCGGVGGMMVLERMRGNARRRIGG